MKKRVTFIILFIAVLLLVIGCSQVEPAKIPIENTSMEIIDTDDSNMPENWSNNCWGNNTTVFSYINEGYLDERSVKIEVSDYEDGDTKWFFDPIKLEPGDYIFSSYYRSDVDTRVVVAINTNTGEIEYKDLPDAPANEEWTKYEAPFMIPDYADTITIYHLLTQNGYLNTDDYEIKPHSYEGFDRGLVTITFDDGWEVNTKTALPIMQEFGYKSNQFYATYYIENPWVPNPRELIQQFIDDGHEIGSHTVTHPYLTKVSSEQVTAELSESKSYLENFLGIDIIYFATPYGAYNTGVNEKIMTYYKAHRTAVESGYNSKDIFDVSRLKCQSVLSSTTLAQVEEWVKKAKAEKLWLILLYHRIADDPSESDTTPEMFYEHMQLIKDESLPVVTFSQAIAELECQ